MPQETPSPVDLPEPEDRAGLGWAAGAMAVAAFVLLLTNAVSLRDWIDDLPPGPAQAQAAMVADQWVTLTERTGVGRPRAWLHDQWKRIEAAEFR